MTKLMQLHCTLRPHQHFHHTAHACMVVFVIDRRVCFSDLSYNAISSIPSGAFSGLTKLQVLWVCRFVMICSVKCDMFVNRLHRRHHHQCRPHHYQHHRHVIIIDCVLVVLLQLYTASSLHWCKIRSCICDAQHWCIAGTWTATWSLPFPVVYSAVSLD